MSIKNIQTAHLVHDLKNPVNIIETGARSLLDNQERYGALSSKQEKVVRRLLRNAIKLRHLANSMLEVDMAAMGVIRVSTSTVCDILKTALVEVFDIVDPGVSDALEHAATIDKIQGILSANHIYLEADEFQLNRSIEVDETKLCLILTNLLSNAFKYKEHCVYLSCKSDNNYLVLSVRDDGPGIPDSYHKQIFEQYFQYIKVDGFPVRGHGLGLAGAKALAEALGGGLSLAKTSRGAEFIVRVKCSSKS